MYDNMNSKGDYLFRADTSGFKGVNCTDDNIPFSKHFDPPLSLFGEIGPEYFLVLPCRFDNDIIYYGEKDDISGFDEWVYVLKNSKVRQDFTAAGAQIASERLDLLKMTREERTIRGQAWSDEIEQKSQLYTARMQGFERGLAIGRAEAKGLLEVVRNLKAGGMPHQEIAKLTKLSLEDIELL
jgi:hypothetical protein